jgi:hypothetical protein
VAGRGWPGQRRGRKTGNREPAKVGRHVASVSSVAPDPGFHG